MGCAGYSHITMGFVKTVRQTDQTAFRFADDGGDGFLDPRVVVHRSKRHSHPLRTVQRLRLDKEAKTVSGLKMAPTRATSERSPSTIEAIFPSALGRKSCEPGKVAAGPREAPNIPQAHRIGQ